MALAKLIVPGDLYRNASIIVIIITQPFAIDPAQECPLTP